MAGILKRGLLVRPPAGRSTVCAELRSDKLVVKSEEMQRCDGRVDSVGERKREQREE